MVSMEALQPTAAARLATAQAGTNQAALREAIAEAELAKAVDEAALATAVMTICSSGDHIVASSRMYGANINLLENTLPRFGITTTFVDMNINSVVTSIRYSIFIPFIKRWT